MAEKLRNCRICGIEPAVKCGAGMVRIYCPICGNSVSFRSRNPHRSDAFKTASMLWNSATTADYNATEGQGQNVDD